MARHEERRLLRRGFVKCSSGTALLRTLVAKLSAALLVCLCILPTTAPFSAVGSTDWPTVRHTTGIGTLSAPASSTDDDNDALVLEQSHYLRQARACVAAVVAFSDVAIVPEFVLPPDSSPRLIIDPPSLNTVLRL